MNERKLNLKYLKFPRNICTVCSFISVKKYWLIAQLGLLVWGIMGIMAIMGVPDNMGWVDGRADGWPVVIRMVKLRTRLCTMNLVLMGDI